MGGDKLLDQIFNLKFTSKQLVRQSHKCGKEEKSEKLKVKKAIEKGNIDGAKIYAQNAIRKKTETLNYLRLASRLDAVVSRLDTQAKMQVRLASCPVHCQACLKQRRVCLLATACLQHLVWPCLGLPSFMSLCCKRPGP